ncbi:YccF domain-containing protein [uncultured Shewanella sp.]|uniref:YccF domain-containing protein n=1 Tax=uncultured Shewanella sp. TaxID=173975 RepID=UPI0026290972|nr:YccF domain-containing protein [uncultured Shewanella sp.]
MGVFRLAFNIAWFIMGGFIMGLAWWLAGLICIISIIGIPFAKSCFIIGEMTFWPFGQNAVNRQTITGHSDIGTGTFGMLGNIIWFLLVGFWLAIGHIICAIASASASAIASAITIIGIPFAFQHLKLAKLTVIPIGQTIISTQ